MSAISFNSRPIKWQPSQSTYPYFWITDYFLQGIGSFGFCKKGKGLFGPEEYPIDVVLKFSLPTKKSIDSLKNEISILLYLDQIMQHPHIVTFIASFENPLGHPILALSLYERSLEQAIIETPLSSPCIIHGAFQLIQGLSFLHSSGIFHHDIKPSNILINGPFLMSESKPMFQLCITDFGLSTFITDGFKHSRGTLGYISPEMLDPNYRFYTFSSDLFSLGCVLGFMKKKAPIFPPILEVRAYKNTILSVIETTQNSFSILYPSLDRICFSPFHYDRTDFFLFRLLKRLLQIIPEHRSSSEKIIKLIQQHLS